MDSCNKRNERERRVPGGDIRASQRHNIRAVTNARWCDFLSAEPKQCNPGRSLRINLCRCDRHNLTLVNDKTDKNGCLS